MIGNHVSAFVLRIVCAAARHAYAQPRHVAPLHLYVIAGGDMRYAANVAEAADV